MPRGSIHCETGMLLRERDSLVLVRDDGGRWRLDVGRKADRLVGQRVTVEGVRSDFDVLFVKAIARH